MSDESPIVPLGEPLDADQLAVAWMQAQPGNARVRLPDGTGWLLTDGPDVLREFPADADIAVKGTVWGRPAPAADVDAGSDNVINISGGREPLDGDWLTFGNPDRPPHAFGYARQDVTFDGGDGGGAATAYSFPPTELPHRLHFAGGGDVVQRAGTWEYVAPRRPRAQTSARHIAKQRHIEQRIDAENLHMGDLVLLTGPPIMQQAWDDIRERFNRRGVTLIYMDEDVRVAAVNHQHIELSPEDRNAD